ncbi:MAG: colicin import membrane protein [Kiritimatiellia bacterium]|jgi:colicin import membrane protein
MRSLWPAIFISMIGHGVLVWLVVWGWSAATPRENIKQPSYIKATLVQLEEKAKPTVKPTLKPVVKDNTAKQQAAKQQQRAKKLAAQKRAKQQKAEKQRKNQLAKKKAEAENKQAELQKKQERQRKVDLLQELEKERQQELQQTIALENARIRADQQAAENATIAQSYSSVIDEKVSDNWSRPPSARNDMRVFLRIQLVPTGNVIGVDVITSSGDSAFDRSAIRAVKKAERFPELQKIPNHIFEQYFRVFNLEFSPEDLRQ